MRNEQPPFTGPSSVCSKINQAIKRTEKALMHSPHQGASYAQIFPFYHNCQVTLDISVFPGAQLIVIGAPGNIQGNLNHDAIGAYY